MADQSKRASGDETGSEESEEEEDFLPGFATFQDYSKVGPEFYAAVCHVDV